MKLQKALSIGNFYDRIMIVALEYLVDNGIQYDCHTVKVIPNTCVQVTVEQNIYNIQIEENECVAKLVGFYDNDTTMLQYETYMIELIVGQVNKQINTGGF